MSCILRISGNELDVNSLLKCISITPDSTWHKGEKRFPKSNTNHKINDSSGIRFVTSEAEFSELSEQINDSIGFLQKHGQDILTITRFPGVESSVLDFGAEIYPPGWSWFTFPPELLLLAGKANLSLSRSVYPTDLEENNT